MTNLILPVINGISDRLREIDSTAKIYTDSPDNVADNSVGYFYIKGPIYVSSKAHLQDVHKMRLTFDIMYFPAEYSQTDAGTLSGMSFLMTEALYQIQPAGLVGGEYEPIGRGKRGFDIATSVVDGVVHVSVGYDLWLSENEVRELVKEVNITYGKNV